MFQRLGQFVCRWRYGVIVAWLLLLLLLRAASPAWEAVAWDGDLEQLPADSATSRAAAMRAQAFPEDRASSQIMLVFARDNRPLSAEDRQYALQLAAEMQRLPELPLVDEVWTEKTPVVGPLLASRTGQAQRVVARLTSDFMAVQNIAALQAVLALVERHRETAPAGLEIGVTGSAAIGGDMLSAAAASLRDTHRVTILLVSLGLILIYRSPWLVFVPLASIVVAVVASLDLLAILAQWTTNHPDVWPATRVFTTTKIFVVVLLFGAGTDYCLFLIARFREYRAAGLTPAEASAAALGKVGVALAASALTTVVGLAMMGFAQYGKFAYSGPAIAVSLLVGLATCVTLAPALLATGIGAAVDGVAPARAAAASAFWNLLARAVVRRPGRILGGALVLSLPLVAAGWSTEVTYDIFKELPADSPSRRGSHLMQQHYPAGEIGPLSLLAYSPGAQFDDVEGRIRIAHLAKLIDDLPGVEKVRSLYRPTGAPAGSVSVFTSGGLSDLAAASSPLAEEAFVSTTPPFSGQLTRLSIILDDEPFSAQAVQTCRQIGRALSQLRSDPDSPWFHAEFEMLGPTQGVLDLQQVTLADRRRIEVYAAAGVMLVLCALLRRPGVCCYLIASVLLSYFVTLGVAETLFRFWYGDDYLGLDWKVPVFLFVVLVAVGQDYNVYLVTRVFEEQRRVGPVAGLRLGIVRTGGIITSCGLIMAAAFASMTVGSLRGMVEMGAALSLGILLDTLVVRTVLVPSFLAILARTGRAPVDVLAATRR